MDFPLRQKHAAMAKDLYALRDSMLNRDFLSRHIVMNLEWRLSLHLSLLARMGVSEFSASGSDPERFLLFATALQTNDEVVLRDTSLLALEQLLDETLSAQPVYDAFTLFPPSTDLLLKLYQEQPAARASLFALWRGRQVDLPAALINQAELQSEDPRLRYEALAYAANHPAFGLSQFSAYYEPLLTAAGHIPLDEQLLEPVLWGGLVRGDRKAPKALARAVELAQSPEVGARLLRLMALNADPEHLPILQAAWERSPEFDVRCWALTGFADSARYLIQRLGQPARAMQVLEDWFFLTGLELPDRPLLALVDKQGQRVEPDPDMEHRLKRIPDSATARSWWESQREAWGKRRWILGRPDDVAWVFELCRDYTGKALDDLMDLLALKLKQPFGVRGRWDWQLFGTDVLNALEKRACLPGEGGG